MGGGEGRRGASAHVLYCPGQVPMELEFSMAGGYVENLKKKTQNWVVDTCGG